MLPVLTVLSVLTVLPVLLGVVGGIWGLGYNLRVCCLNEAYFDTALLDIQIVAMEFLENWYRAARELFNQAWVVLPNFDVI
ncbi:hypothetical protein DVP82_23785 [Yersinia enterocolitica]|nr:hypothetical protein [Yersinia enterocolitica]